MAAAALCVLGSCTSDDAPVAQQPREIRLTSAVDGATTRSFDAANIPVNSTVWVWADQINGTNNLRMDYFFAWKLNANGNGGLASTKAKLYPATNSLNFFGLKGNFDATITENTTLLPVKDTEKELDGIIHLISDDQTKAADYNSSDLLYGQLKGRTATNGDATIPFYHMLSRIQVVLIPGYGGDNNNLLNTESLSNAVVKVLDMYDCVKFTADTTKNIGDATTGRDLREAMITIPSIAEKKPITIMTETSTEADLTDGGYGDAIVAPTKADLPVGTKLIQVDYMGRTTYYTLTEPLRLESGKRYRFKLYLDRIGDTYTIVPDLTVTPWGEEQVVPTDFK